MLLEARVERQEGVVKSLVYYQPIPEACNLQEVSEELDRKRCINIYRRSNEDKGGERG